MSRRGAKLPKRPPSSIFLAYDSWPVDDQILWRKARLKGSLLKNDGRAASWRPDTIAKNELDYSRFLVWIARIHPDELALPAIARVTRDRIKAYEEDLHLSLAPLSVSSHLLGLGFMMGALSNGSDFSWITCAAQRLERRSAPVRNNRSRLRSPHELVELGFRLMQESEEGKSAGG